MSCRATCNAASCFVILFLPEKQNKSSPLPPIITCTWIISKNIRHYCVSPINSGCHIFPLQTVITCLPRSPAVRNIAFPVREIPVAEIQVRALRMQQRKSCKKQYRQQQFSHIRCTIKNFAKIQLYQIQIISKNLQNISIFIYFNTIKRQFWQER